MDKNTKLWIASTKAWIKTQKIAIASCDMAINHHRQNIAMTERAIKSEGEEKLLKINQLKEVEKSLAKYA